MSKKTRKKSERKTAAASTKRMISKPKHSTATKSGRVSKQSKASSASKTSSASKASKPAAAKPKGKPAARSTLVEGTKAPAFLLPRDGGEQVSLADYAGQKLVVFFYPRADTPGCTREAIDFTRLRDAFAKAGTAIIGVSGDPLKAQEAFRNKHQLSVPLASDEKHQMLEAYGAWGEKSMYGRTFEGIIRTTVLISADGRIARVWRNVRVDGHADEVLAAAQAA